MESATCQGEVWITDGAAPVTLDGVGGAAGACEEEGESVAKVAELAEVVCAAGLTIEEGDGLESDEGDVGCVGTGPGDGVLRPFREHVEVGALLPELSAELEARKCVHYPKFVIRAAASECSCSHINSSHQGTRCVTYAFGSSFSPTLR